MTAIEDLKPGDRIVLPIDGQRRTYTVAGLYQPLPGHSLREIGLCDDTGRLVGAWLGRKGDPIETP